MKRDIEASLIYTYSMQGIPMYVGQVSQMRSLSMSLSSIPQL